MKLLSYTVGGKASYGVWREDGVLDLGELLASHYPDLKSALAPEGLAALRAAAASGGTVLRPEALQFLPLIPNPGKIWCCGLNYGEHVRETGREETEQPMFFLRVADSQAGHLEPLVRPPESVQFDFEGEIAVVIGKPGRRIAEADAWDHIAGYACYNDASVRDWQRHTAQWGPGKNFWRTGAFGPWLLTADEVAPGAELRLRTRLNGQVMQEASTRQMLHSIPRQIAYLSTIAPLQTGDVIVTGTPGGVGARRTPPVWMKAGDVVEVEIEGIGVLRNRVVDEA